MNEAYKPTRESSNKSDGSGKYDTLETAKSEISYEIKPKAKHEINSNYSFVNCT